MYTLYLMCTKFELCLHFGLKKLQSYKKFRLFDYLLKVETRVSENSRRLKNK